MTCFKPISAVRSWDGSVKVLKSSGNLAGDLKLPCGQCLGCRIAKSREWAVRCVHEAQTHKKNSFITLTYNDESMPPDWGLKIEDWQQFAKNLRHKIGPFRYLHCGEYSDPTEQSEGNRPHYHAIIFGEDFSADRTLWKTDRGSKIYRSKLLEETWGKGFCTIGAVSFQSAAYVARYVIKKINGEGAADHYYRPNQFTGEMFNVRPEYISMSRRPGLGAKWIMRYKTDVYPSDEIVLEGRKFRVPRFYDNQLPEKELDQVKAKRLVNALQHSDDQTPARLKTREAVLQEKLKTLKRKI